MSARHSCGGPVFGRLAPRGDCRRCDELRFGAPPVVWTGCTPEDKRRRAQDAAARLQAIRNHDCKASGCGPVCTAFDW